jgi:nucleotide-binding universal stress UspA family protein
MSVNKIAIAIPIEEKLLHPLHGWGARFDWSHIQEVHFIHIVKKIMSPLEFGLVEVPDEKSFKDMLPSLNRFLRQEAVKIIPSSFRGKVFFHLTLDFSPEEEVISLLNKLKLSLVVVSTQGRHGLASLLHSSFTDKMVKFAPCDVFVVRP